MKDIDLKEETPVHYNESDLAQINSFMEQVTPYNAGNWHVRSGADNGMTWCTINNERRLSRIFWHNGNLAGRLDLSGSAVEKIQIGNTHIEILRLHNCKSLAYLDCSLSELVELDVRGCSALTHLDCSATSLKSIDLTGCDSLELLDCSKNDIQDLDLTACPNLDTLECYNTPIEELDLSHNLELQKVLCYGTDIEKLDVSANKAIRYIECSSDAMREIIIPKEAIGHVLLAFNEGAAKFNEFNLTATAPGFIKPYTIKMFRNSIWVTATPLTIQGDDALIVVRSE